MATGGPRTARSHASWTGMPSWASPSAYDWTRRSAELLLPPDAPQPVDALPQGMSATHDGVVIAGAAIGTAAFVEDYGKQRVDHTIRVMQSIAELGRVEPGDAMGDEFS